MRRYKYKDVISARINANQKISAALLGDTSKLEQIAMVIARAYKNKNKVICFGNGGSATDAQHVAAELLGKYRMNRGGLPAIALSSNIASLTAISNDYSFADVFSRQIAAFGLKGDVALGLSTSGNSVNVINAFKMAKIKGLITIGLTGKAGGKIKHIVDFCHCAQSNDTPRVQEAHTLIGHIVCELVERELFSDDR